MHHQHAPIPYAVKLKTQFVRCQRIIHHSELSKQNYLEMVVFVINYRGCLSKLSSVSNAWCEMICYNSVFITYLRCSQLRYKILSLIKIMGMLNVTCLIRYFSWLVSLTRVVEECVRNYKW